MATTPSPVQTTSPASPDEPTALERINAAIQDYRGKNYNILCPAVLQQLPEWFSVVLKVVQIDPDPDHRQVYKATPGSEELSLGKVPLSNLAAAAGISWKWSASGRVDDDRDPNKVRYRAVASIEEQQTYLKKSMKARLDELAARRTRLSLTISRGQEVREVEVHVVPSGDGLVSEVRIDTGEVLRVRPAGEGECQPRLNLSSERSASAREGTA